jgi:outer membrane protein assembly factor BamB
MLLASGQEKAGGTFTELVTYRGLGEALSTVVGPGPSPGSERYYVSYTYLGGTAEIVEVDPETGDYHVFTLPDKRAGAARALAVGPDGKIYIGSIVNAEVYRIDPATQTIQDLGRASQTESYIWEFALGSDNQLYGCTSPNAKLIRCDPKTGTLSDLGRMDSEQQYARFIAADKKGFLYIGIGFAKCHLVVYDIHSGTHRDIMPPQYQTSEYAVTVYQGTDENCYAELGQTSVGTIAVWRLDGGNAVPIPKEQKPALIHSNHLKTGEAIVLRDASVSTVDPRTKQTVKHPYLYPGKELNLFRLGMGPDGMLYGGTSMPLHFIRVNPTTGQLTDLGYLGTYQSGGEVYSFLPSGKYLLAAAYVGLAPLMLYDPEKPLQPGNKTDPNPMLAASSLASTWRPMAMISAPNGDIYIGALPRYGHLGGMLTVFNPASQQITGSYSLYPDQSVISLANWKGQVVGATTVQGGSGSTPTARAAKLFLWDPEQHKLLFDTVPVPGATYITNLVTTANGLVFGLAGSLSDANHLFVFDPAKRKTIYTATLPFHINGNIYNSLALGPDGRLYGLYSSGVFSIDPKSYQARVEATYTGAELSAGFALSGHNLYFASGPKIVRYAIP